MVARLPWRRRTEEELAPPPTTEEAQEAIKASRASANRVRAMWPAVHRVTTDLDREMFENGFSARFSNAMTTRGHS